MPNLDTTDSIAAASILMLGGSALAVIFLALERYASRAIRHRITGGAVLILGAAAVVVWLATGSAWVAAATGALAVCCVAAFALRSAAVSRVAGYIAQPAAMWGLVLAASLGLGLYVAQRPTEEYVPPPALAVGSNYHEILGFAAVTDLGRPLSLFEYEEDASLSEAELATLGVEKYRFQIIRIAEPSERCNCHGWVYTGGQFAIRSRDVAALLEDNAYEEVREPLPGDIVIYRNHVGEIAHTGLVRLAEPGGLTLVESKWGPLGVYLHPLVAQPYGEEYKFYRSPRKGHLVMVGMDDDAELARVNTIMDTPPGQSGSALKLNSSPPVQPGQQEIYDRPIVRVPGQRKT